MSAPAAPVAQLQDVSLQYGKTCALKAVSLEIPAQCMVGLIGPDGVGKSSLLALIAGARKIQSGQIEVLGGDMASRAHRRQVCPHIAYMPQGLGKNLYPTLSVIENLDFFARLFGQAEAERKTRIAVLLRSTGLSEFGERPAGKLSGGMKQKLGLCCALIHDPDLLILDEPTTGVDPLSRNQFWELIERIRRQRPQMSVLVATAYMEEAERFDHLLAIDDGAVLATGSPAELLQRTQCSSLEEAFIALMPEAKRQGHKQLVIPPRPAGEQKIAIEARDLSMRFGDFVAVDHVDFRIERGEIFGFLGSNGCGKTTTMKMLTGLLPASEGQALLFGQEVNASDMATRKRVGYMSQSFSLYAELSVRQNLVLHAQLFHVPATEIAGRVTAMAERFSLGDIMEQLPERLPLGIRQRLSLAVAVIHKPEILILDEPTSGVDPIARDVFWQMMLDLSRNDGVTIFISTHFMNEAERCDRISLMHAGQVLACDTPAALQQQFAGATLEDAFITCLEQAQAAAPADKAGQPAEPSEKAAPEHEAKTTATANTPVPVSPRFSLRRLRAVAVREGKELRRDPVRLAFALLGSMFMMVIFGYGISLDVENLRFAAFDQDNSAQSRSYLEAFRGSRYFEEHATVSSPQELHQRLQRSEVKIVLEIPPGFGRDLYAGRQPQVAVWLDGSMPFRAETSRNYIEAVHVENLTALTANSSTASAPAPSAGLETRFRYNQDVVSVNAIGPGVMALILVFIPAMLTALGVVREKELGSISNFYSTPLSRLEFLFGKQLPYIAVSLLNLALLVAINRWLFGVPLKGSVLTLAFGGLLYVLATTSLGLLISAFTKTQIAAILGTMILTSLPTIQFSGLIVPRSSLAGGAALMGDLFPAGYFLDVAVGTFTKALDLRELWPQCLALLGFFIGFTGLSLAMLKKQEA